MSGARTQSSLLDLPPPVAEEVVSRLPEADRERVERELAAYRSRVEQLAQQRSKDLLNSQRLMLNNEKLASVGQLASGIAHEINTPIQYVGDNLKALADFFADLHTLVDKYRTLTQAVQEGHATIADANELIAEEESLDLEYILQDAPKAIAQALDGVARVSAIVRAMKGFSHEDRGVSSMVDINTALQNTLTVARNEYKYVADAVTEFGDLPAVECHASEVNQVFLNLLINASHAIADTGEHGTITIRTRCLGEQVEIAIADTGTGIPEEVRNRIFDPFFTTKEVGKGTGQGLTISHHIVTRRHGGTLVFETEVGKGTTFFIRLPVRLADPGSQEGHPQ